MLSFVSAREFMRTNLLTLRPDEPVLDGVFRLLEQNISGMPVVDADRNFLGVFSEKCCFEAMEHFIDSAARSGHHVPRVHEFMNRRVISLAPHDDVFEAIDRLLKNKISGAPVVDASGIYRGVFSEKTAMQVVISAVYDQVPGSEVDRYTNLDRNRLIDADAGLAEACQIFLQTPYRRLPVVKNDRMEGQVSRRDALRAEYHLAMSVGDRLVPAYGGEREMGPFRSGSVGDFMDRHAMTRNPQTDMLGIAEAFLNSPYRRIPIVENGKLIGQVSRRDLLDVASEILRPPLEEVRISPKVLYLSSLSETVPPRFS